MYCYAGIAEPVVLKQSDKGIGLGKQEEYDRIVVEATKERRKVRIILHICRCFFYFISFSYCQMDIELEQSDQVKQDRAVAAVKIDETKLALKKMNREFYCDLCDKQYKNIAEVGSLCTM